MDIREFETILKVGEHIGVEFKSAKGGPKDDTFETVCSFLNRFGGDIFLGVTDAGEVVGVPKDAVAGMIKNIIKVTNNPELLKPFVIYSDRLVCDNASKAMRCGPITPDNLSPVSKNPIIARFFKQMGRADELGSGTRNLFKYTKLYSNSLPVLDEGDTFSVAVPLDDGYSVENGNENYTESTQKTLQKSTQKSTQKTELNHTDGVIVECLSKNARTTISELASTVQMSDDGVKKALKRLKESGVIRRVGPDKGGHWEVTATE